MNAAASMRSAREVNSSSRRSRSAVPFRRADNKRSSACAPVVDAAEISEVGVYTDGVHMTTSRSLDALRTPRRGASR